MRDRKLAWNGNEIVFEDAQNVGVAGIAPGQPDAFGEMLVQRWNDAELLFAIQAQVEELTEALRVRSAQLGVACLRHDLVHGLACGRCLKEAETQVETLQGEVCKLRGVLEMLEWVPDVALRINQPHHCPWCGGRHRHLDDCPRQVALNNKEA